MDCHFASEERPRKFFPRVLSERCRVELHWDDKRLQRPSIDVTKRPEFYFCPLGSFDDTILLTYRPAHEAFIEMCSNLAAVDPFAGVGVISLI